MRPIVCAVVVAVVCGWLRIADARTLLFFHSSDPQDFIGQGETILITTQTASFNAYDHPGGVHFTIQDGGTFWTLSLTAPTGSSLAPGSYDGARRFQSGGSPGLDFGGDGRGCNQSQGRFDVLDATYAPNGDVLSFSADFENNCELTMPPLYGSIRFRAGDESCTAAPDGTSCDDLDPCTATATCQGGVCVAASESDACVGTGCTTAMACDPSDATCYPVDPLPDGTACDDGDPCTLADSCHEGMCVTDVCEPSQGVCTSGRTSCWMLTGKVKYRGPKGAGGGAFNGAISAYENGHYELAAPLLGCGDEASPVEIGNETPRGRGRFDLVPTNSDSFATALSACLGGSIVDQKVQGSVRINPAGTKLVGTRKTTSDVFFTGGRVAKHVLSIRMRGKRP